MASLVRRRHHRVEGHGYANGGKRHCGLTHEKVASVIPRPKGRPANCARGEDVKLEFVLVASITCLAIISATPALTASRQIQDYCSKQAIRANATFWHRGDREAFMANCIANLTPTPTTPTPTKKRKYRKY